MKSWISQFFCVLFVAGGVLASVQAQRSSATIRVMTFNIRYDEPRDGINAWANRKRRVADVIRFHKADLIGVQEALRSQLHDLESLVPDIAWCGVGRTDGKEAGEYSAILYKKSRFRLIDTGTFWLSETPHVAGSRGWDAAYPRIVTWAKLRDLRTGKTFVHFNTHFDHVGDKARAASSSLILKKAGETHGRGPFVVTGDFNVVENSGAYKTIIAGTPAIKVVDTRYASVNGHFGGNSTFSAFKDLEPGRTIDYIFVRDGIKVLEHGTLSDRWDGLWASDHLPVLAEIQLP
ncbi:MAG TPA: endonuclease/exonuclease/phosphatase family protein [Pyrinomonadaceae bacterium]|nr:endonuclease/exonuclease/phosphatase family protein [Pyrinomonadaceae bacterium]